MTRDELPPLTTWQQIGLILATPGYDGSGKAFLDESDMADIARLLDEYKAERDAEADELREELDELRAIAENLRSRYYNSANPGWAELKTWLDETAEPSSIQHGRL